MKVFRLAPAAVVLTLLFSACGTVQTPAAAPPTSAQASVIQANAHATNAGNVDAAMALFADDAEMVNPQGTTLIGKAAIRVWTQSQVDRRNKIEIHNVQVSGNTVSWDGKVSRDGKLIANTKAEALVRDGKFTSWTFK